MSLALLTAAAVHGGLFFGIPRTPAPARRAMAESPPVIFLDPMPRVEDEIIIPPDDPDFKPAAGTRRPAQDEPIPVASPRDLEMHVVITPSVTVPPMDVIPFGPPGSGGPGERTWPPNIVASGELDTAPRARVQTPPRYPYPARQTAQTGNVVVEFTVDESGRVISPRVIDSTNRAFDDAALQGVANWRFEPGKREGRVVRFRMIVPIHFSLND